MYRNTCEYLYSAVLKAWLEILGFLAWMEFQVQRECREIQGYQEFQDIQDGKEKEVCLVLVDQMECLVSLVLR
jgi:hypothetical protein